MTEVARILLVEDERNLALTLSEKLVEAGYDVTHVPTRAEAVFEIEKRAFALAILDVGLPDGTGFQVAEKIRELKPRTAILFLTAFSDPESRVRGLELGAEDYVGKPFHLKELMLRVRNALKRAHWVGSPLEAGAIRVGRAEIDLEKFEARVDDTVHRLTHKELALFRLLLERRGKAVSRDEILDAVWSEEEFPTSRTIDNFIVRLRRLIEVDPEDPQIIKSVRGVGYLLA